MTNEQISDYLRRFEYQYYKQLETCTKENEKLKKLEVNISKLKAEKTNRKLI